MKILIVGPPAFGYTRYIYDALCKIKNVDADLVYIDKSRFKYKNSSHRVLNFFSKTFLNVNSKIVFQDQIVLNKLNSTTTWDIVFIIRPDLLSDKSIKEISDKTDKCIAFYYDSIRRFPRKQNILPFFDQVYSYDKIDVKKYNLKFKTNYIYHESNETNHEYTFFNISSHDMRFESIKKISSYIASKKWSSKVIVFHPKKIIEDGNHYLTVDNKLRTVKEVSLMIKKSKILFEVQRDDQVGLSFRVFEALGHKKKLITTNQDIVNYDFYHPQNILVVDVDNLHIPNEFVESPYFDIDKSILEHYKIDNWVKQIFDI